MVPLCPAQIARLVVRRFHEQGRQRQELDQLTARETEILDHISRGLSTKEIAALLNLSDRTIGSHLRNIYDKLQVHSRAAAVARFLQAVRSAPRLAAPALGPFSCVK